MNSIFQDKIAVVTGGANGIGLGLAKELCNRGASVVVADILPDDMNKAVEMLRANGGKAIGTYFTSIRHFIPNSVGVSYLPLCLDFSLVDGVSLRYPNLTKTR